GRSAPGTAAPPLRAPRAGQARSVLAPERDHVPAKDKVVADEHGQAGAQLDGHRLVVRGAQPQGGSAVRSLAIGELQEAEEDGSISAEREALLLDANPAVTEHRFE